MPSASLWWFFSTSANSNSLNSLILFGSWSFLSCLEHTSIFSQITHGLHCSLYHYPEPKAMSQTSSRERIACVVSQRAFKGASCSHVQWVNTNLKSIPRVWSCVFPLYPLQNNGQPNKQWTPCLVAWGHWGVTGLVRDADGQSLCQLTSNFHLAFPSGGTWDGKMNEIYFSHHDYTLLMSGQESVGLECWLLSLLVNPIEP